MARGLGRILAFCVLTIACHGPADERPPNEPHRPKSPFPGAEPIDSVCASADHLVVLGDGEQPAAAAFEGSSGQPALAIAVREPDGRRGVLLVDLGNDRRVLRHNIDQWRATLGEEPPAHAAVVLSHGHPMAGLFSPSPADRPTESGESFREVFDALGPMAVAAPNLDFFCRQHGARLDGETRKICGERGRTLQPGLEPLLWSDGERSSRIWTLTWPVLEAEDRHLPFVPLETLIVVSQPPGYFVLSVCSHPPVDLDPTGKTPWHAVTLVEREIAAGRLPPGPVHTVVTGLCGVAQALDTTRQKSGSEPGEQALADLWQKLWQRTGVQRLFLFHCGLFTGELFPPLDLSLPGQVRTADPGACIPLAPPQLR